VNTVLVPEPVRELLCAIAEGWAPAPMVLGKVESLRYAGADLTDVAEAVELQGDRLRVTFAANHADPQVPLHMDGKLEGTLAGGARFCGDTVLHLSRSGSFSRAAGMHRSVTIEAAEWTV
jgi:hypothetical protein